MGLHSSIVGANVSCPQLNSKNNGLLGLLFKSILWRPICFLTFFATDGKDENGLKLEKVGPTFSSFDAISTKNNKNVIMGCSFWYNSLDIHLIRPLSNNFSEELIQSNKIFIT